MLVRAPPGELFWQPSRFGAIHQLSHVNSRVRGAKVAEDLVLIVAHEHPVGVNGNGGGGVAHAGVPFAALQFLMSNLHGPWLVDVVASIASMASLVLFLVPVTLIMHPFWADHASMQRQNDLINFGKNIGLLGSSLMFLAVPRPWPYSLERRLRLPVRAPA